VLTPSLAVRSTSSPAKRGRSNAAPSRPPNPQSVLRHREAGEGDHAKHGGGGGHTHRARPHQTLFHFHSRPEPIRSKRESKIVWQRYPRPLRPGLFSPHPVRTDEVDGERRVNRTAGGLGYVSSAPNLCPMGITAGDPRLAAWVLPPRAPRRLRLYTKHIEA
jgi:hypothetical protein